MKFPLMLALLIFTFPFDIFHIFPVWWLIMGYFFNCPPKHLGIISIVVFVGGIVGFFILFACGGGAGGSSEVSARAWDCFLPYMAIQNMVLGLIFLSGKRKKVISFFIDNHTEEKPN